jgi:hypothetical protein
MKADADRIVVLNANQLQNSKEFGYDLFSTRP